MLVWCPTTVLRSSFYFCISISFYFDNSFCFLFLSLRSAFITAIGIFLCQFNVSPLTFLTFQSISTKYEWNSIQFSSFCCWSVSSPAALFDLFAVLLSNKTILQIWCWFLFCLSQQFSSHRLSLISLLQHSSAAELPIVVQMERS